MVDYNQYLDITASITHVSAPTPFGYYDSDTQFQTEANAMVKYVYRKLGGSILDVELTNKDVYACMEEAILEYGSMINSYQAKNLLLDLIGTFTGSMSGAENKNPRYTLGMSLKRAEAYGSEALVGGTRTLYSGSITLSRGTQSYDLVSLLSASGQIGASDRIQIRELFHFSPTAAYRFFDTTSAINYLNNQFKFESFTPETVFYLLPVWEDILRGQQLEMSQRVRRSQYSYTIVNNNLKLFPVPTNHGTKLHFTYYLQNGDIFDENDPYTNGVSNLSNVPFGNLNFSQINSMGKHWVRRFALSLSREVLGQVRSKTASIPIPNGELVLNGTDLINQAREEQTVLREELKNLLDSMTYSALAELAANEADNMMRQLQKIPLLPQIG